MSLTIPPALQSKILTRAEESGTTVHEFLEHLIADEEAQIAHTEALLMEGIESGDRFELTDEVWDEIDRESGFKAALERIGRA